MNINDKLDKVYELLLKRKKSKDRATGYDNEITAYTSGNIENAPEEFVGLSLSNKKLCVIDCEMYLYKIDKDFKKEPWFESFVDNILDRLNDVEYRNSL